MNRGKQLADNFVLNMRAVRRRKEIQLIDLAKRASMTPQTLEAVERGKTHIKLHDAVNIANVLNIDFMELLKGCIQDVED